MIHLGISRAGPGFGPGPKKLEPKSPGPEPDRTFGLINQARTQPKRTKA
jgi:hypothetical protein